MPVIASPDFLLKIKNNALDVNNYKGLSPNDGINKLGYTNNNNFIEIVNANQLRYLENYQTAGLNSTNYTEVYFSDEQQNSSSGAGGDPYIVTLDNKLYKMQNHLTFFCQLIF